MPVKAEQKYNGTVTSGSSLIETQTGTLGYQVNLECEDGETAFVIWLTKKNQERAVKVFTEALGVDAAKLTDPNFLEHELAQQIEGREVSFGTGWNEYKGKKTMQVQWLGKKRDSLDGSIHTAAATFFGGAVGGGDIGNGQADGGLEDDDIPF